MKKLFKYFESVTNLWNINIQGNQKGYLLSLRIIISCIQFFAESSNV